MKPLFKAAITQVDRGCVSVSKRESIDKMKVMQEKFYAMMSAWAGASFETLMESIQVQT